MTAPPEGSRIAWSTDNKKNNIVARAWHMYGSDDKYWALMDMLRDIAKTHGEERFLTYSLG